MGGKDQDFQSCSDELRVDASMTDYGVLTIRLAGVLDIATSHQLTDALGQWLGIDECIVDLSECEFVDSNGIRALLTCKYEVEGGGRMRLVGAPANVGRALKLAGLQSVLEIASDESAAQDSPRP